MADGYVNVDSGGTTMVRLRVCVSDGAFAMVCVCVSVFEGNLLQVINYTSITHTH